MEQVRSIYYFVKLSYVWEVDSYIYSDMVEVALSVCVQLKSQMSHLSNQYCAFIHIAKFVSANKMTKSKSNLPLGHRIQASKRELFLILGNIIMAVKIAWKELLVVSL